MSSLRYGKAKSVGENQSLHEVSELLVSDSLGWIGNKEIITTLKSTEEKGRMIWILTRTTLHYASWFRDSKTQRRCRSPVLSRALTDLCIPEHTRQLQAFVRRLLRCTYFSYEGETNKKFNDHNAEYQVF